MTYTGYTFYGNIHMIDISENATVKEVLTKFEYHNCIRVAGEGSFYVYEGNHMWRASFVSKSGSKL